MRGGALPLVWLLALTGAVGAQSHPFAVGAREAPAAPDGGWIGWVLAQQAHFYSALTGAVREAAAHPSAF